jgi:hypothetical protein
MFSGPIRLSNLPALFLLGPIRENRSLGVRIAYYLMTFLTNIGLNLLIFQCQAVTRNVFDHFRLYANENSNI